MFEIKALQLVEEEKIANQQHDAVMGEIVEPREKKRTVKLDFKKIDVLKDLVLCLPELHEFVSGIEVGQKLVLDISQETMRKI